MDLVLTDEEKKRRACERSRRWREANPDREKKRKREWARNNPKRRHLALKQKFGITLDQYNQMLADQDGGCKICGKTPEQEGRALAVDHCHTTGKIRGILCAGCNTDLAVLEKDPQKLQRMLDYLDQ